MTNKPKTPKAGDVDAEAKGQLMTSQNDGIGQGAAEEPKAYARLADVPTEELASRLVTTLIMQKGNLNQYDAVLSRFIANTRAEFADETAKLRAAITALLKVRPSNWDDDEDPEQVAAWKQAQAALGPACVNHSDQPSITNLDGEDLCRECADAWVRGEGQAAADREADDLQDGAF